MKRCRDSVCPVDIEYEATALLRSVRIRLLREVASYSTTEGKKKKCTLVQALRLCTGGTAHRGSIGIAVIFHDRGTRRDEGSASRPGRCLPTGKDPVSIVQEAGWAPGPVWTGAENLSSTGIRSRTFLPVASRYTD